VKRALALLLLLLVAAVPLAGRLRAQAPPQPESSRIGLGPVLGGVLTGAFRPVLMNYLYIRADILAGEGRFDEQVTLFRSMVQLYPHNADARGFLGWELAFNSKSEAATRELGWRWAREGLDILADAQPDTVALWFMTQCGQNAYGLYRYAGPDWVAERWIRARALGWTERTWGKRLARFDAALLAEPPTEEVLGRIRRVRILRMALLDAWMRTGESDKLEACVRELRWLAWVFQGIAEQKLAAEQQADALEAIHRAEFDRTAFAEVDETEANALWALGMHRADVPMLKSALAIFEERRHHDFDSERRIVGAWIAWLEGDRAGPRPPHPFDE
jgi:hypothetical protein